MEQNRELRSTPTPTWSIHLQQRKQKYAMEKKIVSLEIVLGNWTYKRTKPGLFLIPYTKINWKLMKDLNLRPEIIKLPEENLSSNSFDIGHRNIFLGMYSLAN